MSVHIPSGIGRGDTGSTMSSLSDSHINSNLPPMNATFVGREKELTQLKAIYNSVVGEGEGASDHEDFAMIVLEARSGSGKTQLVSEFVDRIIKQQQEKASKKTCCVLSGKFDSLMDAPSTDSYSAMFAALTSLQEHFLEHSGNDLKRLRDDLSQTMGEERHLLGQLVPSLCSILGAEHSEHDIPNAETLENGRNRLHLLFLNFFKALSCNGRPVLLFLDDVQWIDDASLDLLTDLLMDHSQNNLMVIASIRREEKYAHRAEYLMSLNRKIHLIQLDNLSQESINTFLSTSLRQDNTKALTEVVYRKTHGNIFYVKQMLEIMKHKGLMTFDFVKYQWVYDVEEVSVKIPHADNVADILLQEIKSVSSDIRTALMYAAHVRSTFDLELLGSVLQAMEVDIQNLKEVLDSAVATSLLQFMKASQKYAFSHDRIQEAFGDSIIAELETAALSEFRLAIGGILVEQSRSEKGESWMFFAGIKHLNEGYASEPRSPENNLPQAELNLEAGKRAIEKSALKEASEYFQTGLDALKRASGSPWESHYQLMLQILQRLAEILFSLGNFALGDALSAEILQNATSMQDKFSTYSCLANSLGRREKHKEAFELCKDILYQLDAFPRHFVVPKIAASLRQVRKMLQGHTDRDILNLPLMTEETNKEDLVRMEFLTEFGLRAFYLNRLPITLFCILLEIKLTFKSGLSPRASQAFAAYGMILADTFGDFVGALRMGELARGVLRVTKGVFMEPLALFTVAAFIEAWNAPRQHVLELLQTAMSSGIRCGDFENAFRGRGVKNIYAFVAGYGLPQIEESVEAVCGLCKQYEVEAIYVMLSPFHILLECLTGKRSVDWDEIGTAPPFSTDKKDPSATYRLYLYYLYRLQLAFYFGNLELAGMFVDKLEPYCKIDTTYTGTIMRVFFSGLTSFALLRTTGEMKYKRRSKRFVSEIEKLMKRGGKNILQKYLLMKAEYTASKSKAQNESDQKAMYWEAIRTASRAGFTNDAALGHELAGSYFARTRNPSDDDALYYFNRARERYDEWGAHGKSRDILKHCMGRTLSSPGSTICDTTVSGVASINKSSAVTKWTSGDSEMFQHVTGISNSKSQVSLLSMQ